MAARASSSSPPPATCTDDKRQEFILLSDTLGVLDAHRRAEPRASRRARPRRRCSGRSTSTTRRTYAQGADIASGAPGRAAVRRRHACAGPTASRSPSAEVDVWQADEDGFYDVQYARAGRARAARARAAHAMPQGGCASAAVAARRLPGADRRPGRPHAGRERAAIHGGRRTCTSRIQAPGYQHADHPRVPRRRPVSRQRRRVRRAQLVDRADAENPAKPGATCCTTISCSTHRTDTCRRLTRSHRLRSTLQRRAHIEARPATRWPSRRRPRSASGRSHRAAHGCRRSGARWRASAAAAAPHRARSRPCRRPDRTRRRHGRHRAVNAALSSPARSAARCACEQRLRRRCGRAPTKAIIACRSLKAASRRSPLRGPACSATVPTVADIDAAAGAARHSRR